METITATQYDLSEWRYISRKVYEDPFNAIELDAVITDARDRSWRVPAYWAGAHEWRVRFAPPTAGTYRVRSICTDEANVDLHGREVVLEASPGRSDNLLITRGPLRVAPSGRTLEHADGTPFFWLGDTWWMGLCKRWSWPDDFKQMTADRVAKGFTVIQIVAGLYPDMPGFDERGANEAGYPWEADYARINPAYFDRADERIEWLVQSGLVPCIVASWAYYMLTVGLEKMKQHWRNLIARWGCYPVVWCVAGEIAMPFYLSQDKATDSQLQKDAWTRVGHYVRQIDPFHRLVTAHPTAAARDQVADEAILDFDMLQTGHSDWSSVANTVTLAAREYAREPHMPVINGEVVYEGHMQANWQNLQRMVFWGSVLNGSAGHTYGAGGIWQINTRQQPYGASPHGGTYENTPWDEAMHLPGSRQLGLGKALLMRYPWWRLAPHPEWVQPHWTPENCLLPYAAGIPGELRIVYIPGRFYDWSGPTILALEDDVRYHAFYFSPINGAEYDLGTAAAGADGAWQAPRVPLAQDWVLVLERQ